MKALIEKYETNTDGIPAQILEYVVESEDGSFGYEFEFGVFFDSNPPKVVELYYWKNESKRNTFVKRRRDCSFFSSIPSFTRKVSLPT